jgi:hypothetical protein
MQYIRGTLAERFWPKVDVRDPDDCWLWLAARNNQGYGVIGRGRAAEGVALAHRVSWQIAHGRPPTAQAHVSHTCDTPLCVNPRHLVEGTRTDNMRDMVTKGRNYHVTHPERLAWGERNNHAKLTEVDVREIRASAEGSVALGLRYGVNRHTIAHVRSRKTWARTP